MSRVVRSWLMIVAPLCAFLVAPASASKHNVQAKSGEETHIWNFYSCKRSWQIVGDAGAFVGHGTPLCRTVMKKRQVDAQSRRNLGPLVTDRTQNAPRAGRARASVISLRGYIGFSRTA